MNPLISAFGWTLVHFMWQGLLLGCATALALAALRNARPEHRYAVACAAMLACACWPAAELTLRLTGDGAAEANYLLPEGWVGGADAGQLPLFGGLQQAMGWIAGLWALCAAALTLRMALGLLWIERAGSHGALPQPHWESRLKSLAKRFGVTRTVRLRVVDNLSSPITAGCWRPLVLLPATLVAGMPPDLLEALLAHEMAHIRHHDYLVNLLQNVIETLLFYHPAVWWISGRIRIEREQMADDFAARQLGEPRRLALALSELERIQFSTHHLAQAANGGDLMVRIKRLLRPTPQALNWKAAIPMLGLTVACLSIYAQAVAADSGMSDKTKAEINMSSCAQPAYPEASIKANETGTVTLDFLIDADGKLSQSKVKKSSGHPALDEAALSGLSKCSFKPGIAQGKPKSSWVAVQYVWALH